MSQVVFSFINVVNSVLVIFVVVDVSVVVVVEVTLLFVKLITIF